MERCVLRCGGMRFMLRRCDAWRWLGVGGDAADRIRVRAMTVEIANTMRVVFGEYRDDGLGCSILVGAQHIYFFTSALIGAWRSCVCPRDRS